MAKKPSHLIYGLEDKPPLWVTLTLGLQHIFPMTSTLILPVIIVKEIGGGPELAENVIKGIGKVTRTAKTPSLTLLAEVGDEDSS